MKKTSNTSNKEFLDNFGIPNSVSPPTKYLTFGPWIYLVPQFMPKDVLILGYAGGTVAGLIELLYGNVPITAVDIEPPGFLYKNVNFVQANAQEYVKTCKHFDAVIVDLFPNDKRGECDFVATEEFANDLSKIGNYIIVNMSQESDMSSYKNMELVGVNHPNGLTNRIYYFQTVKIPNLKIFQKNG